jgi:hypothetical protein
MLDGFYFPTITIQMSLAVSMACLCFFSGVGTDDDSEREPIGRELTMLVLILAVPCLLALVATNYQHMRLVDFASVYDLRADSSKAAQLPILAYTNLWLSAILYHSWDCPARTGLFRIWRCWLFADLSCNRSESADTVAAHHDRHLLRFKQGEAFVEPSRDIQFGFGFDHDSIAQ